MFGCAEFAPFVKSWHDLWHEQACLSRYFRYCGEILSSIISANYQYVNICPPHQEVEGGLHFIICTVSVKLLDKSTDSKDKILSYTCLHIVRQVSEYREEACD